VGVIVPHPSLDEALRRADPLPAWADVLTVDVPGDPISQGSLRSFERGGRTFTKSSNAGPLERWRGDIRSEVKASQGRQRVDTWPLEGPIAMRMSFALARPQAHFLPANSKRPKPELRLDAPHWAPGGKDIDKLARAVLDALTGFVYVDDSQVVSIVAAKRYCAPAEGPGLHLEIKRAEVTR
jgi:crossover junction endodeoxyribonuclease RusA